MVTERFHRSCVAVLLVSRLEQNKRFLHTSRVAKTTAPDAATYSVIDKLFLNSKMPRVPLSVPFGDVQLEAPARYLVTLLPSLSEGA